MLFARRKRHTPGCVKQCRWCGAIAPNAKWQICAICHIKMAPDGRPENMAHLLRVLNIRLSDWTYRHISQPIFILWMNYRWRYRLIMMSVACVVYLVLALIGTRVWPELGRIFPLPRF